MLRRRLTAGLRDQRGVGLVEAIVAGLLLLIGVIGAISIFDSSGDESATGQRQQIAAERAQAEIERLRALPYSELAIDSAADPGWVASGQPGNPLDRVGGSAPNYTFAVSDSGSEEMVMSVNPNRGVAPLTSVSPSSGSAEPGMRIYRFVSWRDVECTVADTTSFGGGFDALLDELQAGGGGAFDVLDDLIGPGSLIGNLLGFTLNATLRTELLEIEIVLEDLDQVIQSRVAGLESLIEGLDGLEIDACDLDAEALEALEGTALFSAITPALETLAAALDTYDNSCIPLTRLCLGNRQPVLDAIAALEAILDPDEVAADLDALADALEAVSLSDHTHNTKRVTVAVVLDPRDSTGPTKPVWATSVISDPDSGLLTGP